MVLDAVVEVVARLVMVTVAMARLVARPVAMAVAVAAAGIVSCLTAPPSHHLALADCCGASRHAALLSSRCASLSSFL